MTSISYSWHDGAAMRDFTLVRVAGTEGAPYDFGDAPPYAAVELPGFFLGTVPVTQALWTHLCGDDNPSLHRGPELPVENVSWDALTAAGGFLERMNESRIAAALSAEAGQSLTFRLPTETEWEYAARGGPHWRDGHPYSGSADVDAVAWYERRHGDHTQPVAMKAPNALGLYDMSGNVWEWCQDTFTRDVNAIPRDGRPYEDAGDERVLRGGCFHNWAEHCTVSKRYEISRAFHDGCIGVRLAASARTA